MEEGEEQVMRRVSSLSLLTPSISESGQGQLVSATVGRVMASLLNAKPKKLKTAISCLRSQAKITAPVDFSLEQSLWFLHKYVAEAEEKDGHMDQVLVPMIEHELKIKESKHGNQNTILLNWLFLDEGLFQVVVRNLAGIISRKDDRYVALGWFILGRRLIEYENPENNLETSGIRKNYDGILKIFCSCINQVLSIMCNGRNIQDGFELPTRLAVAAADFIVSLTVALTRKDLASKNKHNKQNSSVVYSKNMSPTSLPSSSGESETKKWSKGSELPTDSEMKMMLWNNLDALITLLEKLSAWNRKSRSLYANGLERVLKWLQEIEEQYGCCQNEADSSMLKAGSSLLFSCWKHYGILLHLEDRNFSHQWKELLDQYLSGIQFYAGDHVEESSAGREGITETINFFLNCLLLTLGRLDNQQFGNALDEFGSRVSQALMSQLQCADEEVIDGAISIFKAIIFRTNNTLSKSSLDETREMDAVLPLLLNFLDEQDAAAKAIVKLVAEYCSRHSNSNCLQEVLKRFDSKSVAQRRNAFDVVADIVHMSSGSDCSLSRAMWKHVADHLLKCLEDEDLIIQSHAANLIPKIDPPLVLPALVGLSCSTNDKVQLSASTTLIALLINHKQEPEILCMLIDCLSSLREGSDLSGSPFSSKEGSGLDSGSLLKLLPDWAKNVEDWNAITGALIVKMLAEPSNAVIVRFLSHISEYMAAAVDVIFDRLLSHAREQKDSTLLYGNFRRTCDLHENKHISVEGTDCIAALVINRALSKSEFEDVRKLAAELCGRLHPKILIPVLSSKLEDAAYTRDILSIKICLFSFCTALTVRGYEACGQPNFFRIRKSVQNILGWPSVDKDEISKAQHGCIDCLALMLCSELHDPQSAELSTMENPSFADSKKHSGDSAHRGSVLLYVINQLTDNKKFSFESDGGDWKSEGTTHLSFRLCMANVLISACQKMPATGKKPFVKKIVPCVICAIGEMVEPEIRSACVQVLFSTAYHMKSLILPYSSDLLAVALKSLKGGSQKEKMAGAKLLVCLMASEEEVVERVSEGLLEARGLLQNLSTTDPSLDKNRNLNLYCVACYGAMAIAAAAVVVPLGVLFFISGLVVNLIQAICYVLVRPLSKNTYRRINRVVAELLWLELVWLVDWWAGVKIELYTDAETFKLMGKEHALVMSNHKSDIDWLVGWVLAQRSGCLGSTLAVMKKSSKLLPVIGWSMWFSEYLFLERSWAKDETTLKSGLQRLRDFPRPFWLALFVEGTRFTQAKLLAAQEYASSTGLPVPRNVLIPRTKGFVTAVSHMRSFVPAIYNVTVAIPKTSPAPTMLRLFKGQSSVVHVHLQRELMKDLPDTDDAVAQWCRDIFVAKDKLLDTYMAEGSFGDQLQNTGRPVKSLLVVGSWAILLILGTLKVCQWSSVFSSWKGVTLSAIGLAIVTALMQILIQFSQSERSTPAKIAPAKLKSDGTSLTR
ncbi:hypothetical protein F511_23254 [Dorcoceras hygrometricum]|uniref:Phospholipid/glycerol acyltransferase domain-containing protein n=1 Tax=Dorcoceras hygrometricum TaxID=472368 RepID=A0A2Z7CU59_9LAMI|nr:hypothetical protein F511_23254 [Dorcoceras hygrometricum]